MASTTKTSLSAPSHSATSSTLLANISDYGKTAGLTHSAKSSHVLKKLCKVKKLSIPVDDSRGRDVPGYLHLPSDYKPSKLQTAAILLSGARGGVVGPSSIYLSMADKLASLPRNGIPTLRLDYRFAACNKHCVRDLYAGMSLLEKEYLVSKFVLVGWSFGGAPVFTVGGAEKEKVVGCAMVASQTAETDGIEDLAPRPLLLLHGTDDRTLSPKCSESLYRMYGKGVERELVLFERGDHALTRNVVEGGGNALKVRHELCGR